MAKLEILEKRNKEIAKELHNFVKDLGDILGTSPEYLDLIVDIWGHWDAVIPVYRLYNLIPGYMNRPPQQISLFSADTLMELKDKAEELAEYQRKKKEHLS